MINLTPYSVLTVILITNIFILLFIIFTSFKTVISKIPLWILNVIILIIGLRLLLPFEFIFTHLISSNNILPKVNYIFKFTIIKNNEIFTVLNLFCFIWILLAIILIFSFFFRYLFLCKTTKYIENTKNSKILKQLNLIKEQYKYKFKTKIILNKEVKFPSEFGFFNQVIFINDYDYTENEIYYILLHELIHFNLRTNIIMLFINIINLILWWNPVVYLLRKHFENLIEIYVDRYVTKKLSSKDKINYIKCIFKVYDLTNNQNRSIPKLVNSAIGGSTGKTILKRFEIINIKQSHKRANILVCILLFFSLFIYIYISINYVIQPIWEPPAEDMESIYYKCNNENSYIIKEGDLYILYYKGKPELATPSIEDLPKVVYIKER